MAGDWIKMRADLFTHPKVVRMASALKADRLRTVGGLMSAWCLFDAHSIDGTLDGYTSATLDEHLSWPGFAAAMVAVEWLADDGESLALPSFDTHNGASAKRRAMDAERKRTVRKTSASEADKTRTREEKRREEKEIPAPKARSAVGLQTFLDECKASGEKAVPDDDPIFDYAEKVGLPPEYLVLAWAWFTDAMADKRKKDWRAHFRNAVRNNWPRYWYAVEGGGWKLTTAGEQAARARQ